jgi:hypothetical protein
MANTWTKIATGTTTANGQTITLSSIPSIYTDLFLVVNMRAIDAQGSGRIYMKINNSATSYSVKRGYFYPTNAYGADTITEGGQIGWADGTSGYPSAMVVHIGQYANTTYVKKYSSWVVNHAPNTDGLGGFFWGIWSNASAISQLEFYPESGSIRSGCTVTLYGITAGGAGSVAGS